MLRLVVTCPRLAGGTSPCRQGEYFHLETLMAADYFQPVAHTELVARPGAFSSALDMTAGDRPRSQSTRPEKTRLTYPPVQPRAGRAVCVLVSGRDTAHVVAVSAV